jgi:hypothetical protein
MRISYSSLEKFHTCERLFELDKLLIVGAQNEETEHTTFGKAFGSGCQNYLVNRDSDLALLTAWLEFKEELATDKKNLPKLIVALQSAFMQLETLLQDYDLAYFNDTPAIELAFRLNLSADCKDYFVGFIDAVLKNKYTGMFYVLELKHTGIQILDVSPLYQNSGQTLGYSVVLDKIAGSNQQNYGSIYLVAQLGKNFEVKAQLLEFKKNLNDRLIWFLTLKMDYEAICQMRQMGIFPRRGGSCLQYNRPCKHFGTCNLTAFDKPAAEPVDENVYQFVYNLDDLIEDHLSRVQLLEENPV